MEPPESVIGQTSKVEAREKTDEGAGISAPTVSTKRSTFADSKGKGYAQLGSRRCLAEEHFGKELSSVVGQSSLERQCTQRCPRGYSYRLRLSNQQKPKQKGSLAGANPPADPEVLASPLIGQLQLRTSGQQADFLCRNSPRVPTSFSQTSQSGIDQLGGMLRKVPKSKKPGKYVCHYCGRACAKPSVLKKHIRSHTGERPYPCIPCGFSFKTKSNLYKHKKSHAHSVKAGLIPFSELTSVCKGVDPSSLGGEAEVHSDYEQSTDTDEESAAFLSKGSPVPRISLAADRSIMAIGPDCTQSAEELIATPKEVPIVVASEQGIPCTVGECPWFTDINISGHRSSGDEFPTIKQKLALRLTGKKGQDSGTSMNLLSPHSKGSTDSGYFSRSESAEQQISPPNTNAKSYEEIMFGKFYKLGPRSRQTVPIAMAKVTSSDRNIINIQDKSNTMPGSGIGKALECHKSCHYTKDEKLINPIHQNVTTFLRDDVDSQMKISSLPRQYSPNFCQIATSPSEVLPDTGPLVRSNSVPTPPAGNLSAPQGLQGSHSFDERMTSDTGFYRSSVGLRRLRRQAAFEFIAHEGHMEHDNSGTSSKNIFLPPGTVQLDENIPSLSDLKGHGSYSSSIEGYPEVLGPVRVMHHKQVTEIATRKRRKKKSVGDEEDFPIQHDNDFDSSVEMLATDYDSRQEHQDGFRRAFTGIGQLYSIHREPENLATGTCMATDETVLISDLDRKTGGNVISVIQHTNSLSRPSSFEKSDSIDQTFHPLGTLAGQYLEQPDSEKPGEVHLSDPKRSGHTELQQMGSEPADQSYRLPHKLVRQANIQVPEIRVTEEPDKPEEGPDTSNKESEKHVEDFQWPQRSETLSQLPAEKLPPKKKRLRLAEMEHSSGESSFESTCTSLSRSPSQESHLSPSSSFSMSFDREESNKSASPAKQDDFGKQSEFLTVPCSGRTLPVRNQSQRKEVRRSSSEQTACVLNAEVPEIRSKSFDYGGLLSSSNLSDVYGSASAMKERRRGYLVRQAPLSVFPESVTQDKGLALKIKEEQIEGNSSPLLHSLWLSTPSSLTERPNSSPAYDVALSSKGEDSHPGTGFLKQRTSHLLEQQREHWSTEALNKELIGKPAILSPQSEVFCQSELTQRPYLPRASPWSLSDLLSKAFSGSTGLLQPFQTILPPEIAGSQPPPPDTSVPVRIQTQVPSYCSVMYTTVSQILATHSQSNSSAMAICNLKDNTSYTKTSSNDGKVFSLPHIPSNTNEPVHYPLWKLQEVKPARMNTGIPLTLTSGTISTTDASGTGGNKRILSPANSVELFIETKQQKRVKEEKMYGQIVEELSAVELDNTRVTKASGKSQKSDLKSRGSADYQKRMSASPLLHLPSTVVTLPAAEPHLQGVVDTREGMQSPESLDIDEPYPPTAEIQEMMDSKAPLKMLVEIATSQDSTIMGSTILLADVGHDQMSSQFPSLCTSTSVSWCFLNYTKPNTAQTSSIASVYGSWFVSSYNPNPPDLNTKTSLALLRSKQRKTAESYTMASMYPQGTGKVVSSLLWKQKFDQEKPEVMQLDVKLEKRTKDSNIRERVAEGYRQKEPSGKAAEPNRIKIFDGGYKSNEDYVYVRGRGRGKYICEECGIRCKKPSMLKKHIRTHTDVRPYVCKFCNFAFKTKGNLTKHMKSKAHMKKCVELGVSLTSVETPEAEEADNVDEGQRAPWKSDRTGVIAEHQFSDADDSEGVEEEADENEEDDDEDEEYEGDSTPRTRSRSTSPQLSGSPSVPITASAVSLGASSDFPYPAARQPLFGLPDIQLRQKGDRACKAQMVEGQRSTQGLTGDEHEKSLNMAGSLDKTSALSPEHSFTTTDFSPSSLPSPGYDSSPHRDPSPTPHRYLCPSRDLLSQGHLRHVSPKKDISIRRGFSPRVHSSTDLIARPVSPGRDITCKRELSPRSRHRGTIRPVSPRRGMHHHSVPWSQGLNLPSELTTFDSRSDVNMEQRKSSPQTSHLPSEDHRSLVPPSTQQGLFSHLPLHSQLLVRTPVSTVPIGGIQMVPAAPLSAGGLLKNTLGEAVASTVPFQRGEASRKAAGDFPGKQEGLPVPTPERVSQDAGDKAGAPDESVQICMKAIASLRISAQEHPDDRQPPSHPHVNS
ncbi:transcription factor HIVEP2 [Paramormyrops kingsleyae]|uniref:transcription factor HIVEP2 n=1 Tax=Paramormyrops kingsleyae TaxID=1676925 RepID=UPI003B96DC89